MFNKIWLVRVIIPIIVTMIIGVSGWTAVTLIDIPKIYATKTEIKDCINSLEKRMDRSTNENTKQHDRIYEKLDEIERILRRNYDDEDK